MKQLTNERNIAFLPGRRGVRIDQWLLHTPAGFSASQSIYPADFKGKTRQKSKEERPEFLPGYVLFVCFQGLHHFYWSKKINSNQYDAKKVVKTLGNGSSLVTWGCKRCGPASQLLRRLHPTFFYQWFFSNLFLFRFLPGEPV